MTPGKASRQGAVSVAAGGRCGATGRYFTGTITVYRGGGRGANNRQAARRIIVSSQAVTAGMASQAPNGGAANSTTAPALMQQKKKKIMFPRRYANSRLAQMYTKYSIWPKPME